MRQLSKITAPIQPYIIRSAPSYARRRVNPVQDTFTAIVMIRHDETETELFVSDDDRRRRGLDSQAAHPSRPKDRGKFIVVTLTRTDARRFGFVVPVLFDFDRYLPEERADLTDAIEAAKRKRMRFSGQSNNRPTWAGGRHVYA